MLLCCDWSSDVCYSDLAPCALVANQQGQGAPGSQGANTEEPAQPGLVAGLLGVVAVAGALAGRYAGYPAGKREDRK